MSQNLITFEKALKENYLPVWRNQLGIEPSALLGKIKKVPLISNKIVASAPVGLSGGFGYSSEGQPTPQAGGVNFNRFETTAKDMYVNVIVSQKAVSLTGSGGAMANALDTEVKAAYEAAKWNVGRSLYGNGTGVLSKTTGAGTSGTYDGKAVTIIPVESTKYLKEGLILDIYGSDEVVKGTGRLIAIDRANNNITVIGTIEAVADGFVTVQMSYKKEITGLNAIYDDSITSIYGVDKASNGYLYPVVQDANNDLSDGVITKALRAAKNEKNSNIDTLLCGDAAFDHYVDYLREQNIRVEENTKEIVGGFKAIKFAFGNKEVDIINESFVTDDEIWGVESGALELHSQDWNFAELQNGGIFNLMESQSDYRALLVNYGDLICTNPGGCVRITNCA